MRRMISILVVFLAMWAFAEEKQNVPAPAWNTDLEQAKKTASEKGQTIFAFFTGSDWCPWCVKMDKEILSTAEFGKYAGENLVLLKVDFPRKTKLPAEQFEKNVRLAEMYNVEGFPTVVLLDAQGKETGRAGYMPGGGAAFVEHLKKQKESAKK